MRTAGGECGHRLKRKSTSESGPLVGTEKPQGPRQKQPGLRACWAGLVLHPRTPLLPSMPSNDIRGWERLQVDKCVCFCFLSLGYTLFKHPAPEGAAFEYQLKWEALCTALTLKKKSEVQECRVLLERGNVPRKRSLWLIARFP